MIQYIGVVVWENVILKFVQTILKIPILLEFMVWENTIIQAIVQTYDDNRHCDDEVDDDVLYSWLDTYREWSTECPTMMLDDQIQYENSKDSRAGMLTIMRGIKILRGKNLYVNKRKREIKTTLKWMITQK